MSEVRYVFVCEWVDVQASVVRRYQLTYYPKDSTLEMFDLKTKKGFLKRTAYPQVTAKDLYVGATVTIFARQLKVVDYADDYTKKHMETLKQRTLAVILPKGYNAMGQILSAIHQADMVIAKLQMVKLSAEQANELLPRHDCRSMSSDVLVVLELVGQDVNENWRRMVEGPLGSRFPDCLLAAEQHEADRLLDYFFGGRAFPTTAIFNNSTCCVIRPHALPHAGTIIDRILKEGFEISAMRMWYMDKICSEEFLEIYKGVLPEYNQMVEQMCSGPALVLEVRQENAVQAFRQLVGPHDPEIAKHLRPNTLRAALGVDRVKNAIHCTDLPEDGLLEIEYFFNILYDR